LNDKILKTTLLHYRPMSGFFVAQNEAEVEKS